MYYNFQQPSALNNHPTMNSMITNKVNQMLWQRKRERKKVDAYRNKRIRNKYEKIKQQQQIKDHVEEQVRDPQDKRKIDFYNQVFRQQPTYQQKSAKNGSKEYLNNNIQGHNSQTSQFVQNPNLHAENFFKRKEELYKKKHSNNKHINRQRNSKSNDGEVQKMQRKAGKLKDKKKKFIKKMQERTKKGQPVMKNYIKYALTKIEQDIVKQKLDKARTPGQKINKVKKEDRRREDRASQ